MKSMIEILREAKCVYFEVNFESKDMARGIGLTFDRTKKIWCVRKRSQNDEFLDIVNQSAKHYRVISIEGIKQLPDKALLLHHFNKIYRRELIKKHNKPQETEEQIKEKAKKRAANYYKKNREKMIDTATKRYYENLSDHITKRKNDMTINRNVTFYI